MAKKPRHLVHPLYGKVPLVAHSSGTREYFAFDLDFRPTLPKDAVRGEPRKQNLCFHCNVPMYFYVDKPTQCLQCGRHFVFTAKEQKFWYEQLRFYGTSTAIRCPACRRQRRSEANLRQQIASAKQRLDSNPSDVQALFDLSASTLRFFQQTGQGKMDEAIAAARRARKLVPNSAEPLFWEGAAQMALQRRKLGVPILERFIATASGSRRDQGLLKEARSLVE